MMELHTQLDLDKVIRPYFQQKVNKKHKKEVDFRQFKSIQFYISMYDMFVLNYEYECKKYKISVMLDEITKWLGKKPHRRTDPNYVQNRGLIPTNSKQRI